MKNRWWIVTFVVLAISVGTLILFGSNQRSGPTPNRELAQHSASPMLHEPANAGVPRVPAYQAPSQQLGPTLAPAQFVGKAREAYEVAKKIPETLAQLPCYCHCDQSFGHKSLHTCFEDEHASQCAVCVDEALLAYRLQKDEHLTPAQIRQKIIDIYSVNQ
jgi:hypothetical protein